VLLAVALCYQCSRRTNELECAEVDVPDPVVDLLEADVFPDADSRDVHPAAVPADAAIGAEVAVLETIGILERGGRSGMGRADGA
jgi:hypothetical protein